MCQGVRTTQGDLTGLEKPPDELLGPDRADLLLLGGYAVEEVCQAGIHMLHNWQSTLRALEG